MTTNFIKEDNNNYPLKVNIIQREITQKTNHETEVLNPKEIPEVSNNSNSVSHNKRSENDIPSSNYKQNETANISKSKIKNKCNFKRLDSFGNPILKKGKQKISFIDKITKNTFVEVIKIESFKAYNKMEEISHTDMQNNCCIIE